MGSGVLLCSTPQVLEFDMSGRLLGRWGGPGQGYQWPQNPSGIAIDSKGNVWLAAAGVPAAGGRGARGAAAGRGAALFRLSPGSFSVPIMEESWKCAEKPPMEPVPKKSC